MVAVLVMLLAICARADGSVTGSIAVISNAGEVLEDRANVVVFVEGMNDTSRSALPAHGTRSPQSISHKGLEFQPRVLPIAKNTTVDFQNDDHIFHNAFSLSKAKPFDLGIYPKGTSKLVTFDQPGLVRVYCNIHPDMVSNILVLNNSFYAITSVDGGYKIGRIPDGEYVLRVWSEYSDELSRSISITGDRQIEENFRLQQRRRFKSHTDKFGKPYRTKY